MMHACKNIFIMAQPHPLPTMSTHLNMIDDGTMANSSEHTHNRNDAMDRYKWLGCLYCMVLDTTHPTKYPTALNTNSVEYYVYYLCSSDARWGNNGPSAFTIAPYPKNIPQYTMNSFLYLTPTSMGTLLCYNSADSSISIHYLFVYNIMIIIIIWYDVIVCDSMLNMYIIIIIRNGQLLHLIITYSSPIGSHPSLNIIHKAQSLHFHYPTLNQCTTIGARQIRYAIHDICRI